MTTANIFSFSDTWNNISTTFNAIKVDVTDGASASDSTLIDLQVGSTSQFKVDKGGIITAKGFLADGNVDLQGNRLVLDADNDSYINVNGDDSVSVYISGTEVLKFDGAADDKLILDGVSFAPTGAVVGQALGYPNSTTTLEPYTPAGGGDTLKAANETITGNWNFTGDLERNGVAIPLKPANYASHSAYLTAASDDLLSEASVVNFGPSAKRSVPVAISSSSTDYGARIRLAEDVSFTGVIETSDAIFPFAVSDDVARFRLHDLNIISNKSSANSWLISVKPGLSGLKTITAVDTGTDTLTITGHPFTNGQLLRFHAETTPIGGLTDLAEYYVVNAATDTLQLSLSEGGAAINLTSAGTGDQRLAPADLWAEDGLVYGNILRGGTDDIAIAISVDGDTRNVAIVGNVADNVLRVADATRDGHAFAIAGAEGDTGTSKDCLNTIWLANLASNANNLWHAEDPNPGTVFAFNAAHTISKGLEIVNDDGIRHHAYIGNAVSGATDYFIDAVGTGSAYDTVFAFNLFDGAGATQAIANGDGAVRINQLNTKNINYAFNVHSDFTATAFYSDAQGPFNLIGNVFNDITGDGVHWDRGGAIVRLAYNHFDTISDDAILAEGSERTSLAALRPVLVESNNCFEAISGSILDKANSQMVKGDQVIWSDELDGSIAAESIMLAAPRPGVVTAVVRVHTSAGGGGSVSGAFTLKKVPEGGGSPTTLLTNSVQRGAAQYASNVWTGPNAQVLDNEFSAGDLLIVSSDGSADRSTRFRVMVEFFYYN